MEQPHGKEDNDDDDDLDVLDCLCGCFSIRTVNHIRVLLLLVAHLAFHIFVVANYIATNTFLVAVCRAKYMGEAAEHLSRADIVLYRMECDIYENFVWGQAPTVLVPPYIVLSLVFYYISPMRLPWYCGGFRRKRRCKGCKRVERTIALGMIDLLRENQYHVVGDPGAAERKV